MSSVSPSPISPLTAEVMQIASIADPVQRNLRITECYHRLSVAMARRTGQSANWCTFATWASKQAGQTIRGEDILDRLDTRSKETQRLLHPIRAIWGWLIRRGLFNPKSVLGRLTHAIHSPFDAFEFSSDAVARGNLKVFQEIGFQFARYLEQCPADAAIDSPQFRTFQDGLRQGDPPQGQTLLRKAFERYQQSSLNPAARAQSILLANLEIGLHEQTRLQPEIREAMEAGPKTADELGVIALKRVFPGLRFLLLYRVIAAVLRVPAGRFKKYVRDLTCRVVTESLMVLSFPPDLVVQLDRNLDATVPASLQALDDPPLLQLVSQFEPAAGTLDDCGARDWSDVKQRVHFIIHLFRAFQERSELFDAPFSAAQVAVLMEGGVPRGHL